MQNKIIESLKTHLTRMINEHMPLPTSGDFVVGNKKKLAKDIFDSLDGQWCNDNQIAWRHLIPYVSSRQDQQRYARIVLRAMMFIEYSENKRTIPQELSKKNLETFYEKNRWNAGEDLKKVLKYIFLYLP